MKSKNISFGINIGSASLLLIFVVLCLVSFATLSFVSANADYRLTEKVADRTHSYYDACNLAQDSIASIDASLKNAYLTYPSRHEYYDAVGHSICFSVAITENQSLSVSLEILYPEKTGDPFYSISGWNIENTGSMEYHSSLPVFR